MKTTNDNKLVLNDKGVPGNETVELHRAPAHQAQELTVENTAELTLAKRTPRRKK